MVLQSEDAKQLKAEANQACLIAARSSADLGKLHASQGQCCMPNNLFQRASVSDLYHLWIHTPTCACLSASPCICLLARPFLWTHTVCLCVCA